MEGKITLAPEDTKNKESRIIYLEGALLEVIHFQRALRDSKFPECPWVFFGENGDKIKDFRGSWDKAFIEAGLCQILTDDHGQPVKDKKGGGHIRPQQTLPRLQADRSKEHVTAGVPERVAMMISGHKTRSVFERYNIVNENDLKLASKRIKEYHWERAKFESGHNLGIVQAQEAQTQLEAQPVIH